MSGATSPAAPRPRLFITEPKAFELTMAMDGAREAQTRVDDAEEALEVAVDVRRQTGPGGIAARSRELDGARSGLGAAQRRLHEALPAAVSASWYVADPDVADDGLPGWVAFPLAEVPRWRVEEEPEHL